MRKATFVKTAAGNYRPINKKAKVLAKRRSRTLAQLKLFVSKNLSVWVWTDAGLRKVA